MDMFIGHLGDLFLAGLPHFSQVRNGLEFHAGHSAYHTTEAWPYKLLLQMGAMKVNKGYLLVYSLSPDHSKQHSLEPFAHFGAPNKRG